MKLTAIISAFIRIAAVMLFLVGPVTVSAQYKMVVHTDDGLSYSFNTQRIEKVSFVLMTDDEDDEDITSVTGNASEITNNSATIIALAKIPDKTSMDLNVGIIFTTTGTPSNENGKQVTVSPSSLGSDGKYTVKLTDLAPSTIYYYGLSVKWATFNVGATSPEEFGDYYAWGEIENKSTYNWSTYNYGSRTTLTKYNSNSSYGIVDNKFSLDSEDDVAQVKWGGDWRMPTLTEFIELEDNCIWVWYALGNTDFGGVAAYKVISNISGHESNFIFLPVYGYCGVPSLLGVGDEDGFYWSRLSAQILPVATPSSPWILNLLPDDGDDSTLDYFMIGLQHFYGSSVRPVCP